MSSKSWQGLPNSRQALPRSGVSGRQAPPVHLPCDMFGPDGSGAKCFLAPSCINRIQSCHQLFSLLTLQLLTQSIKHFFSAVAAVVAVAVTQ